MLNYFLMGLAGSRQLWIGKHLSFTSGCNGIKRNWPLVWRKSQKIEASRGTSAISMGDFYGFLLCLITILGFLGLKGWKMLQVLTPRTGHGSRLLRPCSFSPISLGAERTSRFGHPSSAEHRVISQFVRGVSSGRVPQNSLRWRWLRDSIYHRIS